MLNKSCIVGCSSASDLGGAVNNKAVNKPALTGNDTRGSKRGTKFVAHDIFKVTQLDAHKPLTVPLSVIGATQGCATYSI